MTVVRDAGGPPTSYGISHRREVVAANPVHRFLLTAVPSLPIGHGLGSEVRESADVPGLAVRDVSEFHGVDRGIGLIPVDVEVEDQPRPLKGEGDEPVKRHVVRE